MGGYLPNDAKLSKIQKKSIILLRKLSVSLKSMLLVRAMRPLCTPLIPYIHPSKKYDVDDDQKELLAMGGINDAVKKRR